MLRRLRPLDRVLLFTLVPLWVVCFALSVRTQVEGGGVTHVGLSLGGPESYPALIGEYSQMYSANPLYEGGLQAGDLLVRVGGSDLRGVGRLGFAIHARRTAGPNLTVPVIYERDGARGKTFFPLAPVSTFLPWLAGSLAFAASALFLLFRARPTPVTSAYFQAGFSLALALCLFSGRLLYAWCFIFVVATTLLGPLLLRLALVFPDSRSPQGRWHAIWPWSFGLLGLFNAITLFGGWITIGEIASNGIVGLLGVALLAVTTVKYQRGGPVARRQVKWVLFGTYCALLPIIVASTLVAFGTDFSWLKYQGSWAYSFFPAFVLVSVARFNLFDIDRLLSAVASYNILAVLLGAGALLVLPRLAEAASTVVGIEPGTGQVVLSLALAALVIPAHRRLRPQIDRVFFKERYALDHGIAELLPRLSHCEDARALTERLGEGLHRLLRSEACVVYASVEESYVPVFVEGRAVPPAFEADNLLIAALRERRAPLALADTGRRPDAPLLGPFDRAALQTLQAEVVVPVRQDDVLAAFLCLGPKRSGDVYTSTDLSLLTAVAETVSQRLQRFDQEAVNREAQAMQASLRRYVPGAVAEQLSSGVDLTAGEREVSVLFVDIRGYTAYTEIRQAHEVFTTINRYTNTVSAIVEKFGGSVVEFNGDGMMAVFGAPTVLPDKERAAVSAGREIITKVQGLGGAGSGTISVGVGVATGSAFVGSIQAVDRMIWTALGNTTNLAARLQGLTRDLDAAMVIDLATWRAAGEPPEFERRDQVAIRGRSRREDVYVLAMRD